MQEPATPDRYDALIEELWTAGTLGITEPASDAAPYLEAFFAEAAEASAFGEPQLVPEADWVAETQAAWPPLEVGDKFFLAPPWCADPTPPERFRLEINPGQQCGTGQHPCTQKCLESMEQLLRPGDAVLDVGSGSGILSLAAKLLGAGRVVACDIDPTARPTPELLARMPGGTLPFFIGSVEAVRSGSFDLAVANISEAVLGPLRPDLERVAPTLILSGFQNAEGEWDRVVVNNRD